MSTVVLGFVLCVSREGGWVVSLFMYYIAQDGPDDSPASVPWVLEIVTCYHTLFLDPFVFN